jgi:prevent-host-death family protein
MQDAPVRTVSASEAKSRLGSMLAWADKNNNEIVIRVYGEPKGVVMSYGEYKKVQELRERERRRKIWEELEALRRKVSARFADIPEDERYRMAGMSESVIRELIAEDAKLAKKHEGTD